MSFIRSYRPVRFRYPQPNPMSQVGSNSTVMVERAGCPEENPWGLSERGSEADRLVWDQDNVGSSPTAPTNF